MGWARFHYRKLDGATGVRPADLPEILAAPDAKGQVCTLASLGATVVIWPEGDESREVRIEMPDRDVTVSTVQNCYAANNPSSPKPILVITWSSSFQLCFYIFKVKVTDEPKMTQIHFLIQFFFLSFDFPVIRTRRTGPSIKLYLPSILRKFRSAMPKVNDIDICYSFRPC